MSAFGKWLHLETFWDGSNDGLTVTFQAVSIRLGASSYADSSSDNATSEEKGSHIIRYTVLGRGSKGSYMTTTRGLSVMVVIAAPERLTRIAECDE